MFWQSKTNFKTQNGRIGSLWKPLDEKLFFLKIFIEVSLANTLFCQRFYKLSHADSGFVQFLRFILYLQTYFLPKILQT
jgi:hypothetical protein